MADIDASELTALASDLGRIGRRTSGAMFNVYRDSGRELEETWRDNARATSGTHGRHYPDSIDSEIRPGLHIEVEVGPNAAKPQGSMAPGFEYGSVNQPPHLDGQRAADVVEPKHLKRIDDALGDLGL